MAVSEATLQWLRDAPVASAEALAALTATTPEPIPPQPLPPGGDMDYPTNEQQLRDALNTYMTENRVGQLDDRTQVEVTSTIELAQKTNAGRPWGVDGHYAQLRWKGPAGQDLLRVLGTLEVPSNRGLTIKNLSLDGGDPNIANMGAAACLRLSAPHGDNGSIYKFTVENVYTMQATNGVVIEGGVYEGWCPNVHAENCAGDGILLQHLNLGAPKPGVVSNVFLLHPNSSRNYGAGIRTVYSVYIIGASCIINGGGGIVAPDGIRGCIFSNGENTAGKAGCFIEVPSNGYGSYIQMCEASSDGQTVCRKWTGSAWEDVGSPMLYLLAMGQGVTEANNHTSYYGPQSPSPMRVVK